LFFFKSDTTSFLNKAFNKVKAKAIFQFNLINRKIIHFPPFPSIFQHL
jgi:hypothetical protein